MELTYLGWAGVEARVGASTLLVDPLLDVHRVFGAAATAGVPVEVPEVQAPSPGCALAVCLTHLHGDHADAAAAAHGGTDDALVLEPRRPDRSDPLHAALWDADARFDELDLERHSLEPWEQRTCGAFEVTALPAVDGIGDPQLSWLVRAGGRSFVHLGDTLFHGAWWRIAAQAGGIDVAFVPINGARVSFPHRQPSTGEAVAMDAEQAVAAAVALGARTVVPIHFDGYAVPGIYQDANRCMERFRSCAREYGVEARVLEPGEQL